MSEPLDHLAARTARTAELVDQLHAIVTELEAMHPGRKFPLDGHLVGSIGEAAAAAMFRLELRPGSTAGHDAISDDGRHVEIKATYGKTSVGIRETSHDHAAALIVLRFSRIAGVAHQTIYNGSLERITSAIGATQRNGQAVRAIAGERHLDVRETSNAESHHLQRHRMRHTGTFAPRCRGGTVRHRGAELGHSSSCCTPRSAPDR